MYFTKHFQLTAFTMLIGFVVAVMVLPLTVFGGDMPNTITYQGYLTDPLGQPVPDGNYQLTFRIFPDSTGGSELWSEVETVVCRIGRVELALSNSLPLDVLSGVDANGQPVPLFLEVQIGSDPPLTPRSRLGGALYAGQAARLRGDINTAPGELSIVDTTLNDTLLLRLKDKGKSSPWLHQSLTSGEKGGVSTMDVSVDSTGPQIEGKKVQTSGGDSFFDVFASATNSGIDAGSANALFDTTIVNIDIDTSGARVSGKKKKDDFSVDSFFDIAVGDGGGGIDVGSANASFDTTIVNIDIDTSGARVSGKKKKNDFTVDSFFDIVASSGGGGVNVVTAKKVVKFKAGTALANTVNKSAAGSAIREGSYMGLAGDLDHFVEINVDSLASSLVFADTMLDTTLLLRTDPSGDGGGEIILKRPLLKAHAHFTPDSLVFVDTTATDTSRIAIVDDSDDVSMTIRRGDNVAMVGFGSFSIAKPRAGGMDTTIFVDGVGSSLTVHRGSGGGTPGSDVQIGDLDGDGDLDLSVDGNIGVGTNTASNILTVQQGSATDPIADAWTTYSSRRWKKNIKPIEGALGKVEKLRGVTYDWKADGKHDIGLIAEEVGEVIPEVVAYEENGVDAKSVDYARLVALLIQGMKEQQTLIEDQDAGLAKQAGEIEGLRNELADLKALVGQLAKQTKNDAQSQFGMK